MPATGQPKPSARVEHANITVSDAQRAAVMLNRLFDWSIRWEGPAIAGGYTVHVGSAESYIALYQRRDRSTDIDYHWEKGIPLNHIGVVVADIDLVETRVKNLGLEPFNHGSYSPGKRFYFLDPDGIEFEVISYT